MAFFVYVTDSLYCMQRNEQVNERWLDLMTRKVDTRSGDEIAEDIIKGAGLEFKDECI